MAGVDERPDRGIRVSDQERNATVELLRDHLTEGRLTTEEFSDRVEAALTARTRGELADLTGDLPEPTLVPAAPTGDLAPPGDHEQRWAQVRRRVAGFVMPNAVCISIWAMTGRGAFWPEWVLFGTGIPFLGWILRGEVQQRKAEEADDDADGDDQDQEVRLPVRPPSGLASGGRRLASVAFVDVVNSTRWALELGDREWSELLARHMDMANEELRGENGQLIFQKGDEIVAAFDGPGRAIRWARAVRTNALSLGLDVRAGVHAGEVESRAGQLSGVALHIGQRVSAAAAPGEILVTSTVEELVAGSGLPLVDGGVRELKGLDRPWRVFSVAEK